MVTRLLREVERAVKTRAVKSSAAFEAFLPNLAGTVSKSRELESYTRHLAPPKTHHAETQILQMLLGALFQECVQ